MQKLQNKTGLIKNIFFKMGIFYTVPMRPFQTPGHNPHPVHETKINFLKYGHNIYHFLQILCRLRKY